MPRHPQPPTARTMRQATGARVVGAPILPPEPARPVATRCVNRGEGRQGTGAHPNGRAHGSRCPTSGGIGRRPCPRFSWAGGGGLKNGIVRRIRPPRSFTRAAAKLATPLFWAAPAPLSPMCRRQRVSGDRAGFIGKKTAVSAGFHGVGSRSGLLPIAHFFRACCDWAAQSMSGFDGGGGLKLGSSCFLAYPPRPRLDVASRLKRKAPGRAARGASRIRKDGVKLARLLAIRNGTPAHAQTFRRRNDCHPGRRRALAGRAPRRFPTGGCRQPAVLRRDRAWRYSSGLCRGTAGVFRSARPLAQPGRQPLAALRLSSKVGGDRTRPRPLRAPNPGCPFRCRSQSRKQMPRLRRPAAATAI